MDTGATVAPQAGGAILEHANDHPNFKCFPLEGTR